MNALFLNLLRTSLVVGAAAAVLALVSPLWNRRWGAAWKKRVWCLLAALALLGAFVRAPSGAARVTVTVPERQVAAVRWAGTASRVPAVNSPSAKSAPAATEAASPAARPAGRSSVSLLTLLEALWAAGAAVFFLRLAAGELLFCRYLRRWATPPRTAALTALYARLLAEQPRRRGPELLVCPGIGSPMLSGLLRPKLLLPREDFSQAEAAYLLRHELIHWRGGDLFWKLLLLCANAVHWFNPALWLLRREAGRDIERACDEQVVAGADLPERRAYGTLLLRAAGQGRAPALSTRFSGGRRALKERLRSILEGKKRRGAALAAAAGILAICAVPLVSCAQETASGRSAALKAYFRAHYSEKTDGCCWADLTQDGADELVVTELWKDAGRKKPLPVQSAVLAWDKTPPRSGRVTVLRVTGGGGVKAVWRGDIGAAGGGYYLYRHSQKDYLFFYNPRCSSKSADYRYRLFSLGADGSEKTAAKGRAACPLPSGGPDSSFSKDDLVQKAHPAFLHTVSTYLQRAAPMARIVPVSDREGMRLGAGWAAYTGLYTRFDAEAGDPADAPAPIRAMAESEMEKRARQWAEQPEIDPTSGKRLSSGVKITDSLLCGLYLRARSSVPDKGIRAEVWEVRFLLKPENPGKTPIAGGQELEGGWLPAGQSVGAPLLGVAAESGGYRLLRSGNSGTVMESMAGSYSFYASELLRRYCGVRPKTISFTASPGVPAEHPFRLTTLSGAGCYLSDGWKSLAPVRPSFLKDYTSVTVRHPAAGGRAAVWFLHDGKSPAGAETARTALKNACLSASKRMGALRFSEGFGNLETSGGLVQQVSALCTESTGERIWRAFTVPDGTGGCWAVVTRGARAGEETADEVWLDCAVLTFCPDPVPGVTKPHEIF